MSVSKTLMHLLLLLIGLATYSVLGVPVGKLTDVEFTESVGEAVGVSYWLRAGKSATTAPSTPITATRCLSSSSTCIFPPSGVISVGEVDELSRGYVTSPAVIEKAIPSEKAIEPTHTMRREWIHSSRTNQVEMEELVARGRGIYQRIHCPNGTHTIAVEIISAGLFKNCTTISDRTVETAKPRNI